MKKKVTKTKMSKVPLIPLTQARGLEDDLASQNKEASKYLSALTDVYNKVIIIQYFPTKAEAMCFKQQYYDFQVMPIVKPPKATEVKGTETIPQVSGRAIH